MWFSHLHFDVRGVAGMLLTACVTGGATPLANDPLVITAPELIDSRAPFAYEAVEKLRPGFLRVRGPSSLMNPAARGPAIFVDGIYSGGVEELSDIPVQDVTRIKYVGAWDAATRFGPDYPNGVIELTTRRGRL
jgi:hypothetical protein